MARATHSRKFQKDVCREGSLTLTLFNGEESEGTNPKNDTRFEGPKQRLMRAAKQIAVKLLSCTLNRCFSFEKSHFSCNWR